jgi:hypothetical protein
MWLIGPLVAGAGSRGAFFIAVWAGGLNSEGAGVRGGAFDGLGPAGQAGASLRAMAR